MMRAFSTLIFFTLPLAAWGADSVSDLKCDLAEDLRPKFDEHQIDDRCGKLEAKACNELLVKMYFHTKEIGAQLDRTCSALEGMKRDLADTFTQKDANGTSVKMLKATGEKFEDLIKVLNKAFRDVGLSMPPLLAQSAFAPTISLNATNYMSSPDGRKAFITEALKNEEKLLDPKTETIRPAKVLPDALNDKNLFGAQNGFVFMKGVRKARKEAEKTLSQITGFQRTAEANVRSLDQPESRDRSPGDRTPAGTVTGPAASSGMDMKTLMGLASAGMGLAGMMKQQQDAANSQATDTQTTPTPPPGDTQKVDPPKGPDPTKFAGDDGKSKDSSNPIKAIFPDGTKKDSSGTKGAHFGPPALNDGSDISKRSGNGNTATGAASPAKSGPAGGGGSSGGGSDTGGGVAGKGHDPGASGEKKEEEAMQGIGGGGLGGGGPSGGGGSGPPSAADPAAAAADDSMKDMLHDMKEAANEGENPGGAAGTEAGVAEMDSLDLFPRVRAAYVRSLKQGKVLNGLGDRIQPE